MSKIGRNDECLCGSGKKYKNCCANKENTMPQEDIRSNFSDNPYYIFNGKYNVPIHDACKSIKDYAIALFEQMIGSIDEKRDDIIKVDSIDLHDLVEIGEEHYYTELKEILKLKGLNSFSIDQFVKENRTHVNDHKLSVSEKIIINHVTTSNLCEYSMQTDFNELDYGAMRVLAELGQQVLSSNISKDNVISGATIYVDKDELKSWKLHLRDSKDTPIDINAPLYIEWIPLNKLDHLASINKTKLCGLTTDSQYKLATALAIEAQYSSDANSIFAFSSLAILLLGIIEKELGNIISILDKSKKYKRMMWYDLCKYVEKHSIPIISENLPLYEILDELRPIRNRVAHGEMITLNEYEIIKQLTYANQLIEFISWEKSTLIPIDVTPLSNL